MTHLEKLRNIVTRSAKSAAVSDDWARLNAAELLLDFDDQDTVALQFLNELAETGSLSGDMKLQVHAIAVLLDLEDSTNDDVPDILINASGTK